MSNIDIIRAWKDEEYRNSLSEEQRSQLPENPVGMLELTSAEMQAVLGGGLNNGGGAETSTNGQVCCSTGDDYNCSTAKACWTDHGTGCGTAGPPWPNTGRINI